MTARQALDERLYRVLFGWNRTGTDFPAVCTHELFERRVAADPSAIAVVYGAERMTYGELNDRANQVAHHLRRRGVGPDALVGVSLHRTPMMVIALLGVWKSGAAYVPLDPAYPPERLAFMVEDAALPVVLTDARAISLFPQGGDRLIPLDSGWAAIERERRDNPQAGATPSNLAYVIYTSGSTGKPKGALIEHRGLVNYLWWAIGSYGVRAGDSVPVHSSISFDLTVTSLYPALLAGGHVDLLAEDVGAQSLLESLREAKHHALVKITPAHLELITRQAGAGQARAMTRAFVIGGENLTAESLRFWREAAPATRLINEYGPTETVVGCCVHEVGPDDPHNGSVPIGRPIANTELYVLDEALQPVAVGAVGELYIGGAGVARGYLNRPELTRERFLPDAFSGRAGARLYKTGDLARYRSDGVLEYLGRVDNQVKVRGYRIELGEIEAALAGQPQVQSCAVLLREDAPGDKQLVAYIVARKGESTTLEALRRFVSERLPDYMVPARFVLLESLPLTHNGKVDRQALPAPTAGDAVAGHAYTAPRNATEASIASIWAELLKLDRVGVDDDVFELGATSLMVLGAVARIRQASGADIAMPVVFANPTVAQMALALGLGAGARAAAGQAQARRPQAPRRADPDASAAVAPQLAPAAQAHLVPIRFGAPGRELLGLYQPPPAQSDRRECCVLCNPFGQEAIRSHRVYRIVADRLARSGFHVLRFDYFGTGDSAGDDHEGSLEAWIDDILRADEELVRRSGCRRSTWLGLRLGASLAALASTRRAYGPQRLVLWDPVLDGAAYLAELARAHIAERSAALEMRWETESRLRSRVTEEARGEALGYPLTAALRAQLGALSPSSLRSARAERIVLLSARPGGDLARLERDLAGSGAEVRARALEAAITWTSNQMLTDSIMPAGDIGSLVLAAGEA
jgi:exosortase A-associated hydrolase 2